MGLRHTARLLAVLLCVAGCSGVSDARIITVSRASYTLVWPDGSQKDPAPRQEIAESSEAILPGAESLPVIAKDDAPTPAALLDHSLFQRPPPTASSRP